MVARRAHNPKVVGSNPAPATNFKNPRFSEGFLLPAISVKRQTGWLLREGVMTGSFIFDTFSVLAQVGRKWRADKLSGIDVNGPAMPYCKRSSENFQTTFNLFSQYAATA